MCEHSDDTVDRRAFLRRAVAGGLTVMGSAAAFPAVAGASSQQAGVTKVGTKPVNLAPPAIVTRAQWGANERLRDSKRVFAPVRKIVVHHSGGPSRPSDPAAMVRDIYALQVKDKGYQDIGYNFLIDHNGVVYEGRWARKYPPGQLHDGEDGHGRGVMGAHATTVNAGTCGICLLGTFSYAPPTAAAMASLVQLAAWKAGRFMIDPTGTDSFSPPFGMTSTFPNIVGHRGVGFTLCPGRALNALLPWVRTQVQQKVGRFPAVHVDLLHSLRFTNGATYPKVMP
jgi:N-acetylmuramoyl-L-alanine amidase